MPSNGGVNEFAHTVETSERATSLARALTSDWSRVRGVAGLLSLLSGTAPLRLSQPAFANLVRELMHAGIEVQLEDGSAVDADTRSPGIHARVRLRIRIEPRSES